MIRSREKEPDIRRMSSGDIESVVALHRRAFPGFFLCFLGDRFLREFYTGIALDPFAIPLLAESDGSPLGFAVGASEPASVYRRLIKRRWWRFAMAALPAVVRKPAIVFRLLRALRKPSKSCSDPATVELMSIGVEPTFQGAGVGHALLRAFLIEALVHGAVTVILSTDAENNDAVNHFYQAAGFQLERDFYSPQGRHMYDYRALLSEL